MASSGFQAALPLHDEYRQAENNPPAGFAGSVGFQAA
jgi:hypothetical protein